ncbi:CHAP domain-containing protein [Terrihabitans soli]|nr:CHAP domain-containing protein [Terrihabitans soli]
MKYPGRVIEPSETDKALLGKIAAKLGARGYAVPEPHHAYTPAFAAAVKLFQSQNVSASGFPLKIDGKIGPITWGAIFEQEPVEAGSNDLVNRSLEIAISQLGVMEKPLGSNGGPEVDQYLKSVGLGTGFFWCMAFVNWCIQKAGADLGKTVKFPRTGGCVKAWNDAVAGGPKSAVLTAADARTSPGKVKPGAVFILSYGKGLGHTGFVRSNAGGALITVEGNTNQDGSRSGLGVFELKRRNVMDAQLKGFILPY